MNPRTIQFVCIFLAALVAALIHKSTGLLLTSACLILTSVLWLIFRNDTNDGDEFWGLLFWLFILPFTVALTLSVALRWYVLPHYTSDLAGKKSQYFVVKIPL